MRATPLSPIIPISAAVPHAPDMAVLSPIFYQGDWVGFAANLAHKSDIGGPVPGSCWSQAREIYQEGLHLPPIKYVSRLSNQQGHRSGAWLQQPHAGAGRR